MLADKEGGPGRSAAFESHIKLFQHLQMTYACFDAYARVSLSIMAHSFHMALCHYTIGFQITQTNLVGESTEHSCWMAGWNGVIMMASTTAVLFKLDMFVERAQLRFNYLPSLLGPLCGVL